MAPTATAIVTAVAAAASSSLEAAAAAAAAYAAPSYHPATRSGPSQSHLQKLVSNSKPSLTIYTTHSIRSTTTTTKKEF